MGSSILEILTASLYPPRCPWCGRARQRAGATGPCRGCRRRLAPIAPGCPRCAEPGAPATCERCLLSPPGPDRTRACLPYRPDPRGEGSPLREALHAWKYRRDLASGAALVALFVDRTRDFPLVADSVVPVPTLRRRLARRGFDQAAELARAVACARGLPLVGALRRIAPADTQTVLGRAARAANVRGAFRIPDPRAVAGKAVLLVDDVLTSGSTTDECARVIRASGGRDVELWVLGRTVRRT